MKTLREDLHELAAHAPDVDLAHLAIRGARRNRAVRLTLAAAVVVVVGIAGGSALLLQEVRPRPPVVLTPPEVKAVPLPEKGVAPVEQAYRLFCRGGCRETGWRILTRSGETFQLPAGPGPVEATADGRRIAYYSEKDRGIMVRDLASGQIWKAPLKQPKRDFAVEYTLRMSPNGLRFIVSGWGGRRKPNMLVDVEQGTVEQLDSGWWPVSVADGDGPVVLAKPYDKTTQVWVRGRKPVTIPTFTYEFSALSPDGRRLVRVGQVLGHGTPMVREDGTIVTFDALTGGSEQRVPVSGLPGDLRPAKLGGWLNAKEVTLVAVAESPRSGGSGVAYAVNVLTGQARELFTLRGEQYAVPGLVR
ncbi:hypothetical protein [Nonomuraea aurantiaca]|uniref:hypothetical protein n=1 Tax=Nonomuraea aurantiaca TaxID=2878562 RepID=UPI001CDA3786|nr:hypothetical protein [Nonomuraea aurantiaca]MCA2219906.1 hypothetical protein [Nonomuraea aurantiaca]